MPNSTAASIYDFGEFVFDGRRMLLRRRNGEVVALPPKALDLLQVFVERAGRLLTKDELLSEVWRGVIVEEGNLTQNISILRKALGETSREHRYIVTVPGRGYRFVASVKKSNGDLPHRTEDFLLGPQTPSAVPVIDGAPTSAEFIDPAERQLDPAAESKPAGRQLNWRVRLAALMTALLVVFVGYTLWKKRSQAPASVGEVKSIAVLPFATIGMGEEEEYLGVGLADALITKLSNIRQFVVRPTNAVARYAGQKTSLSQVGRELGVDALLDGHVQRSGDRVRVTVQLVRSSDGVPLWADSFDDRFTNLFAVQDSISGEVAQALTLKLTGEEQKLIRKRPTENAEAYQLYIKGRYFWNKRTGDGLRRAIGHFEQAIGLDAKFALAYAGLAESYVILNIYSAEHRTDAFPAARDAALKALAIDDTLAAAHTVLALVKVEYEYDWPGAERSYKKALELNPNYATAHHWYSEYLAFMGRFDESVAHVERAYELDPQSPVINTARGYPYMRAHRCDEAMGYFQKALEMEPDFPLARFYLGKCYAAKSRYEEAAREHLRAIEASGESAILLSALGFSYARSGKVGEARAVLEKMKESARRGYVSPYSFATIYAGLGNGREALKWLEKAFEDHDLQLATLKDDIHFESLRHHPQFINLVKRVGLAP